MKKKLSLNACTELGTFSVHKHKSKLMNIEENKYQQAKRVLDLAKSYSTQGPGVSRLGSTAYICVQEHLRGSTPDM